MNATSGEVVINCEPKRLIAEAAERGYKDAMSSGVQEASSLKR
jgi:type IV secretory pathway protease TraF